MEHGNPPGFPRKLRYRSDEDLLTAIRSYRESKNFNPGHGIRNRHAIRVEALRLFLKYRRATGNKFMMKVRRAERASTGTAGPNFVFTSDEDENPPHERERVSIPDNIVEDWTGPDSSYTC